MNFATFLPLFSFFYAALANPNLNNFILDYICKVVSRELLISLLSQFFDSSSLWFTINSTTGHFFICINIEPVSIDYITRFFISNFVGKGFGLKLAKN